MWLQNFRLENKSLSAVELLVLSSVNEKPVKASSIINQLREKMGNVWEPERGTIYPVLHRLAAMNLLERTNPQKLEFRRSDFGRNFLTSLPASAFQSQMEATITYLTSLSDQFIEINPQLALTMLGDFKQKLREMIEHINNLENKARAEDEDWYDIPID